MKECDIADYSDLKTYFDRIIMINRLRENTAFCGFNRIEPPDGNTDISKSINELRKSPYRLRDDAKWLPGIWNRGEGIFFEFKLEEVKKFKYNNDMVNHISSIIGRNDNYFSSYENLDHVYIMMHTFAHLLINQLSYDCGYGSSSIKERIYFSSNDDEMMAGLLIYTTGDSEGSLGGLVRLGKPIYLQNLIISALENSKWCSSDPICIQSRGQGPDGCNMAACHNCAVVSETSCEQGNRYLDRTLLIDEKFGFFKNL